MKKHLPLIWSLLTRTRPMWGMIPLRIIFGMLLVSHGVAHLDDGYFPIFGIIEIIAGGASTAGFMVRLVGLFIALEMIVAQFVPSFSLGFSVDIQTQLLVAGIALLMIFSGGGRHSVDNWLARRHLVKYPDKRWELYSIAETPYTKWWE